MKKVNVAILGTGTIANKLAKAFLITPNANLYAVASRDKEKALAFSEKYNIPNAYGSYEDALDDINTDLVYIALPHPFHYVWAKEALLKGKNVLCEKPLTVNSKQAQELFTIAKEKNLFFSEAMWTRFLPSVKSVVDVVNSGSIGKIKKIKGSVAYNSKNTERMSSLNLAGGMLLDCGVYLITGVFILLGYNYSHFKTKAKLSKEGVDLHSLTHIYYPNGQKASLFAAMDIKGRNKIKIIGEKGVITIKNVFNWQDIKIKTKNGTTFIPISKQKTGGYEYMTEAVCNSILENKTYCRELTPQDTLSVMQFMDSVRSHWKLKYPCEE